MLYGQLISLKKYGNMEVWRIIYILNLDGSVINMCSMILATYVVFIETISPWRSDIKNIKPKNSRLKFSSSFD